MITRQKALSLARKKFGKGAFVEQDRRTLFNGHQLPRSDAERADYRTKYLAAKEAEPKWKPLEEWDGATPLHEYRDALVAYNATKKVWREYSEAVRSLSYYKAFRVRTTSGLFTETKGAGDNWEDALRAAGVDV